MDHEDDLIYIDRVVKGDASSYSYLVDRYQSRAYTLALRIVKNEEDAEEVSQDAFVKAFRSLAKFKKEASFSSWLYRIVYNTALSRIRKKQVYTTSIDSEEQNMSVDDTNHSFYQLVSEDRSRFVKYALGKLSEEDATLIDLFYSHEKNADEIGQIMGLSHSNVRVKLLRSRKKLHGILSRALKKEIREIL